MLDVYLGCRHSELCLQLCERDFAGRWELVEFLQRHGIPFDFYRDFQIDAERAEALARHLATALVSPLNRESPAMLALYALLLKSALQGQALYFVGD